MRWLSVYLLALAVTVFSCGNDTNPEAQQRNVGTNNQSDTTTFYPIYDYIEKQINDVSTTPYFIYQLLEQDKKKDSVPLTVEQFKLLAAQFLQYNIADPALKKYYKEESFGDHTLKTITFSYESTNPDIPLQSADILLDETGTIVKRVFMNKEYNTKDSLVFEKLGWEHNRSFYINRVVQYPGGKQITQHRVVRWR